MTEAVSELVFVGGEPSDETFDHTVWGTFNVSAIWRDIKEHGTDMFQLSEFQLDKSFVDHIAKNEPDKAKVARLTDEQLETPIIMVPMPDGYIVVDGNHRAQGRIDRLDTWITAWELFPSQVERYRIRAYMTGPGGRREIDIAKTMIGNVLTYTDA